MNRTSTDSDSTIRPSLQKGAEKLARQAHAGKHLAENTLDRAAELAQNATHSTVAAVKSVRRRADDFPDPAAIQLAERSAGAPWNLRKRSLDIYNHTANAISKRVVAQPIKSLAIATGIGAALTTLMVAGLRLFGHSR